MLPRCNRACLSAPEPVPQTDTYRHTITHMGSLVGSVHRCRPVVGLPAARMYVGARRPATITGWRALPVAAYRRCGRASAIAVPRMPPARPQQRAWRRRLKIDRPAGARTSGSRDRGRPGRFRWLRVRCWRALYHSPASLSTNEAMPFCLFCACINGETDLQGYRSITLSITVDTYGCVTF